MDARRPVVSILNLRDAIFIVCDILVIDNATHSMSEDQTRSSYMPEAEIIRFFLDRRSTPYKKLTCGWVLTTWFLQPSGRLECTTLACSWLPPGGSSTIANILAWRLGKSTLLALGTSPVHQSSYRKITRSGVWTGSMDTLLLLANFDISEAVTLILKYEKSSKKQ